MNFIKFMSISLAMSLVLATTPAHTMSTIEVIGQTTSVNKAPKGGIRDIIILPYALVVVQDFSSPLDITIYDSKGKQVYSTSTTTLQTTIETSSFPSGDYLIVTLAEGESESQDFEVNL